MVKKIDVLGDTWGAMKRGRELEKLIWTRRLMVGFCEMTIDFAFSELRTRIAIPHLLQWLLA